MVCLLSVIEREEISKIQSTSHLQTRTYYMINMTLHAFNVMHYFLRLKTILIVLIFSVYFVLMLLQCIGDRRHNMQC